MKKNILQKFRPYVTLKVYGTLDELKHDLKLLEATMPNNNARYVSFGEKESDKQLQRIKKSHSIFSKTFLFEAVPKMFPKNFALAELQ